MEIHLRLAYLVPVVTIVFALAIVAVDARQTPVAPGAEVTQSSALSTQKPDPRGSPADQRERWNKEFSSGIPSLRNAQSSEFLAAVIKGLKPGTALDLGIGQGRNAIYLAAQGWDVTGVDISD